jgi:hypothetical protein
MISSSPSSRSLAVTVAALGLTLASPLPANAQTGASKPAADRVGTAPAPKDKSPAGAAPATTGDSLDTRDQARVHFEQGVALYGEGNFASALAEFEAAYKALPAAPVLYNIGLCYKALYRYPEAIDTLNRYLAEGRTDAGLTPQKRTEIEQSVETMSALLAPVTFTLRPREARVVVDGRQIVIPGDGIVQLAAGARLAEVSAEYHQPERREFTVVAGAPLTVTFDLKAIPRTGTAFITSSQPNTRIKIDGKDQGFAPLKVELSVGGHQLEGAVPKYEIFQTEVMLSPGQSRNIDIEMRLPPNPPLYRKWWFWSSLGAVVAGGTATAFLLQPGTAPATVGGLGTGPVNR